MKKTLTVLLLSIVCSTVWAQQGFHIGYKVAPQSTWMFNGDNSDNANYRYVSTWGVAHGPSLAYWFKPTVGVGFDLIFSKQGQKFEVQKESDFTNQLTLRYLKLPILLHFSSDPEQPVQFVGQFGPQFAFLTKGELEVEQTIPGFPPIIPSSEPYDVKDAYKSTNIGMVLGFGIGTNFGTEFLAMTVQLRFDFAFTDAEQKETGDWYYYSSPDPDERPTTFNTTGGIEIGFKYILRTDK